MEQNTSAAESLPTIKNMIKEAWGLYKSRFVTLTAISVIMAVFETVFIQEHNFWLSSLILVIYLGLVVFVQAAIFGNLNKSNDVEFWESIKYAAKNFDKYLWVSALSTLIIIAGVVLVIPAIIWSVSFSFALIIVASEGSRGMQAILRSREYVRGRWLEVLFSVLAFQILIFAIPAIIFSIIDVYTETRSLEILYNTFALPLSMVYVYVLYKYLKLSRPNIEVRDEKRFKIVASLGALLLILALVLGIVFRDVLRENGVFDDMELEVQSQVK